MKKVLAENITTKMYMEAEPQLSVRLYFSNMVINLFHTTPAGELVYINAVHQDKYKSINKRVQFNWSKEAVLKALELELFICQEAQRATTEYEYKKWFDHSTGIYKKGGTFGGYQYHIAKNAKDRGAEHYPKILEAIEAVKAAEW